MNRAIERLKILSQGTVRSDNQHGGATARGGLATLRPAAMMSAAAVCMFLSTGGTAMAQTGPTQEDAWSALVANPNFSDVVAILRYAGLVQYVQTDQFTAFLPTNRAFEENPGVLDSLMLERTRAFPDTTLAVTFMRSHAIYDLHPLSEYSGRSGTLTSISGSPIEIIGTQTGSYTVRWMSVHSEIATAHVVDSPIMTKNAIIYPVDHVVLTTITPQ